MRICVFLVVTPLCVTDVRLSVCPARTGWTRQSGRVQPHGVYGRSRTGDAAHPAAARLPTARGTRPQRGAPTTDAQGARTQNYLVRRARQVLWFCKSSCLFLFVTVILMKYNLTFTVIPLIFCNCSNPCRERHVISVVLQNYSNHCREHHVKITFTQNETNMKMVLLPDGFLGSLFYGSHRAAAKI